MCSKTGPVIRVKTMNCIRFDLITHLALGNLAFLNFLCGKHTYPLVFIKKRNDGLLIDMNDSFHQKTNITKYTFLETMHCRMIYECSYKIEKHLQVKFGIRLFLFDWD